jgi:hypothetical protein
LSKRLTIPQEKKCKDKPKDDYCPYGKKKNGKCRKNPPKACPWGKEDEYDCRKECKDKNKCEKDWRGYCKKDEYGIDVPKPGTDLPDYVPKI